MEFPVPRPKRAIPKCVLFVWVPVALRDELNSFAASQGEAAAYVVRRFLREGLSRSAK
jgi:hypothetical protein